MATITPAVGPNPDGISHQIALAHSQDDAARSELANDLEARPRAKE